jgi:hypothetical protein
MTIFASLNEIQDRKSEPPRIIIYGPEGIGKSSFGASCPSPIFLPTEKGLKEIDVKRWPLITTFEMLLNYIDVLIQDKHKFKSGIIDTLNGVQKLIFKEVSAKAGRGIEDIGYQAGYQMALPYWDILLDKLDELQMIKGMIIICLAHSKVKTYNAPELEPFDRYMLDMHKDGAARVQRWADAVLFVNYKNYISKIKVGMGQEITKSSGIGERSMFTEERPAYIAKNRYDFPHELPFPKGDGWNQLKPYFKSSIKKDSNVEATEEDAGTKPPRGTLTTVDKGDTKLETPVETGSQS